MTADQLRKSILQQAIQGKLVPQDPNDEPTSVLLERIREEKARLVEEKKIKKEKNPSVIFRGEDNSYYEKLGEKIIEIESDYNFPNSWSVVRLSFICILTDGEKKEGQNICLDAKFLRGKTEGNYLKNGRFITKGDNIILVDGENSGEVFTVPCDGYMGSTFKKLWVSSVMNLQYVLYFIQFYKDLLRNSKKGAAIPHLNKELFYSLFIGLPPLKEQQRIVEKIEELIPHIEHYSKAQAELDLLNRNIKEQLKKSVLQYAIEGKLVPQDETEGTAEELLLQIQKEKQKLYEENKLKKKDLEHSIIFKGEDNKYYEKIGKNVTCIDEEIPFEIPNGWVWARMGQIGDWGAGSTPSRSNPNYYNGKILWLKTGELNNGIVFDTEEKITEKAFQECSLRINKVGNVLIAMYGATIGKLAIAGKELTTNQACCGCSPYLINNWYLFYFLMASREQFIKRGEGGAQPNISRVKLVEHLIPLPPLSEQQRIVNTIQNIFRCIEKN
ncbi:type I restriction enzyme S subunit [Capnocytophaga leadbetteri]|uniref:Type I restriction enzyme S subunit n=1 Tax=Capnocytophaga leadbetteri TaxID=327575 RepID=A0A2T5XWJ7_9FLAO|nr:restriction endonuclease subunit S [Capnocytophaga leadbetteri]PTX07764.1 type I restriction enzyme S subunit [Capnocytophaga leadbetteri]